MSVLVSATAIFVLLALGAALLRRGSPADRAAGRLAMERRRSCRRRPF